MLDPKDRAIVDCFGHKKFDLSQLDDGQLPSFYNYKGRRFNIQSVMGRMTLKENGQFEQDSGFDLLGRLVNQKGYLVNAKGDIIDDLGEVIWLSHELKDGEFIKLPPWAKFNIQWVQGKFVGSHEGKKLDELNRPVNQHGFLTDASGNILG